MDTYRSYCTWQTNAVMACLPCSTNYVTWIRYSRLILCFRVTYPAAANTLLPTMQEVSLRIDLYM
jgi:hypothetical protein